MRIVEDRVGEASTLLNIGLIHQTRGSHARALECQEQALARMRELGHQGGEARALTNIGIVHKSLAQHRQALDHLQRALSKMQALGDRDGAATTLRSIASIHGDRGDYAQAIASLEQAHAISEALADRAGMARVLEKLGSVEVERERYEQALALYERALSLNEDAGNRAGVVSSLGNLGLVHRYLGSYETSLGYSERARAAAKELGMRGAEVRSLWGLAVGRLMLGDFAQSVKDARQAVDKLRLLVSGLAEEQGVTARELWVGLMETGVRAGMRLGNVAHVSYFLESGRAGTLLESLGGREALADAVVPDDLLRQETAVRAAVGRAKTRLRRAYATERRLEVQRARATLADALEALTKVVARVQRTAKAAADVAYPKAASLDDIQASLEPGEALVRYAMLSDKTVALVTTHEESRIVRLEKLEDTLLLEDPKQPWQAQAARLREAALEPLGLGKETRRLVVSPAGALSYVPFALLAADREVTYVPSGTTLRVLLEERGKRGTGVLAFGDPDYRVMGDGSIRVGDRQRLRRLPATRDEVKAVATVPVLGRQASESGLRKAVGDRPRWRSVHFACHGLIDPDRPMLSSLALTADETNDGLLTALEIFRLQIPADLVVLSACKTGKGRIYATEGLVGLPRAFMFAGAPRVLCSLWDADDEATRALMVKFYELWNPGDASKGLGCAAALKKAQEFVREHPDHPEWKHPYYWAAWVLWGLGS